MLKSNLSKNDRNNIDELLKFISGYASPVYPQTIDEIQGDFQLAGLSPILNSHLSKEPTPKILDIGCGNGVILKRLDEIDAFKNYSELEYIGFDFQDKLSAAFETANKLMIHSRFRLLPINEQWIDQIKDPCIIIMRNVLHELKIGFAAKFIYQVCKNLPKNSVVLLQDMTTLPIAEKGQAGWFGQHIAEALEAGGIGTNLTTDVSKHGINVFLIEGKRELECNIDEQNFLKILIELRKEQLDIISSRYEAINEEPGNEIHLLRLSHDIAAITLGLKEAGVSITEITGKDDALTLAETFCLTFSALSDEDINILCEKFQYPYIKWFQDRSHPLTAIEEFLRSNKTKFFLFGGPFMGKKTIILELLARKPHGRLPLFVNLKEGSDILEIIEEIAVQLGLGRFIDVEILTSLEKIPTEELKNVIGRAIKRIVPKTILDLDGFENIIDPEGKIENKDIEWLINFWSEQQGAKIIIESRSYANDEFIDQCVVETLATFKSRKDGRYGEFLYTVQLLQDLVPFRYRVSDSEYGGFPLELIKILDNHPHFTYIAGMIISNSQNSNCLKDRDFISTLSNRLYSNLLSSFNLNKSEKETIHALCLLQIEFPLILIGMATGKPSITKGLVEKGLLIENQPGLFRPLGILREQLSRYRRGEEWNEIEQRWHPIFEKVFLQLFEDRSNPAYFRQAHYHATLAGSKPELKIYYLPQISSSAESWYRTGKYKDALWAYKKLKKYRRLSPRERMRMAGCLIRRGEIQQGRNLYENLMKRYKNWDGVRYSYVASLLATGGHAKKALSILTKIPIERRNEYWHLQAARCNKQLLNRNEALNEYEEAVLNMPTSRVWPVINELVTYAREVADSDKEQEWLENYTWNTLKLRSDEVKIDLGAFYERMGFLDKAESLLLNVFERNKSNAYCVLPLVKTLCRLNKISEAKEVLDNTPENIKPKEIFLYAKVVYYKSLCRFKECESLIMESLRTTKHPIHSWGQWADLFLSWSRILEGEEKIEKAKKGLRFVNEILLTHNVPAMITCLNLVEITGDSELKVSLTNAILKVNDSYDFDKI